MFNYDENINDDDYMSKEIENLKEELCIGFRSYFSYDTRWGPPNDFLKKYLNNFHSK